MEVEFATKNQEVLFGELNQGEVFRYYGAYYIKSMTSYKGLVGVDLVSGTQQNFDDTIPVETIDGVLTIK